MFAEGTGASAAAGSGGSGGSGGESVAAAPAAAAAAAARPAAVSGVPGQYRVLQVPFRSGTRPLVVYEDVNAGPGGRVWDASVALARHIASEYSPHELSRRSIIEV